MGATVKRTLAVLAALAVLALLAWPRVHPASSASAPATRSAAAAAAAGSTRGTTGSAGASPVRQQGLREKALAVLAAVDATGRAPAGYVGGRQFMNDGRGGTAPLPRTDGQGRPIVYHEYDVNPYRAGTDRGPQRLVVGSDGSAYCTGDHYVTWVRLR